MKKIILSLTAILITSGLSYADITVQEVRSPEYLKKEGFSSITIRHVQQEAGEYNPKPTNKAQRFGFKIWNYIDPASPEPRDAEAHDVKWYSHFEDY